MSALEKMKKQFGGKEPAPKSLLKMAERNQKQNKENLKYFKSIDDKNKVEATKKHIKETDKIIKKFRGITGRGGGGMMMPPQSMLKNFAKTLFRKI